MTASINAFLEEANTNFTGRAHILRAMVIALIARQNVLLHGPGGTAKSTMARYFFEATTKPYKEFMFQAGTRSSEFIPSVDPVAFRDHGLTQPALQNTIVDPENPVELAIFDELFNAPGETLAALNGVVHPVERKMPWRGIDLPTAIESVVAATNLIPKTLYGGRKDPRFHAAYDRFLFRFNVAAPTSRDDLAALIQRDVANRAATGAGQARATCLIDPAEIDALRTAADQVTVCDMTCRMLHELKVHADSNGYAEIGVRRINFMVKAMQASAALEGRTKVSGEDFDFVVMGSAWDNPNEANGPSALVNQCSTADREAKTHIEGLKRTLRDVVALAHHCDGQGMNDPQMKAAFFADANFQNYTACRDAAEQWLTHTPPDEFWRVLPLQELIEYVGKTDPQSQEVKAVLRNCKARK